MHFPRVSPETSFLGTFKQYLGIYPVANEGVQMKLSRLGKVEVTRMTSLTQGGFSQTLAH